MLPALPRSLPSSKASGAKACSRGKTGRRRYGLLGALSPFFFSWDKRAALNVLRFDLDFFSLFVVFSLHSFRRESPIECSKLKQSRR